LYADVLTATKHDNKKHIKSMFLNFYKNIKNTFYIVSAIFHDHDNSISFGRVKLRKAIVVKFGERAQRHLQFILAKSQGSNLSTGQTGQKVRALFH